jgi:Tol biopolymer transport system component
MKRQGRPVAAGVAVVAALAMAPAAQAAYPGGNGEILFERKDSLYTISPAGPVNSDRRVAKVGATTENPEYSPNGKQIAFSAGLGKGGTDEVIVAKSNGKDARIVTGGIKKCLSARAPSWSPNGKQIAFICNDKGFPTSFEVYTVGANGKGGRKVTETNEVDYVKWNPGDPNEIAFVSGQILYTVPAGGGAATVLNDDPPGITGAGWFDFDYSPDGSVIVAESGEGNLHLMDANTGAFGPSLVNGTTDAQTEPNFSPHGQQIAYVNSGSSVADIHIAPATGAPTGTPLTATPLVPERDPTWRPVG